MQTSLRLDHAADALAQAQAAMAALRLRMSAPRDDGEALLRMSSMLRATAYGQPGTLAFATALAIDEIRRRGEMPVLPPPAIHPQVSVVLCVSHVDACLAALCELSADPASHQAEILLADDGVDPGLAMLPVLVRHLRVISVADDAGADCNLAVSVCRAPTLVLTHGGMIAAPAADDVWIGRLAATALERFGVSLAAPTRRCDGLRIAVSRMLWQAAGGIDSAMIDGQGLEFADLALKLRLLGGRLIVVDDSAAIPAGDIGPTRSWQAVAGFRARWNDVLMKPAHAA